jgi:hypothetical protein
MKRAHCVMVRGCSYRKAHRGALIFGLALAGMALLPRPAWSQSAWPSYPNNTAISVIRSGSVGVVMGTPRTSLGRADNGYKFRQSGRDRLHVEQLGSWGGGVIGWNKQAEGGEMSLGRRC